MVAFLLLLASVVPGVVIVRKVKLQTEHALCGSLSEDSSGAGSSLRAAESGQRPAIFVMPIIDNRHGRVLSGFWD